MICEADIHDTFRRVERWIMLIRYIVIIGGQGPFFALANWRLCEWSNDVAVVEEYLQKIWEEIIPRPSLVTRQVCPPVIVVRRASSIGHSICVNQSFKIILAL